MMDRSLRAFDEGSPRVLLLVCDALLVLRPPCPGLEQMQSGFWRKQKELREQLGGRLAAAGASGKLLAPPITFPLICEMGRMVPPTGWLRGSSAVRWPTVPVCLGLARFCH